MRPRARCAMIRSIRANAHNPPVLLIPGFMCGDPSMRPLATFLRAHGHSPYPAGIACNVDCSEAALGRLHALVAELAERHERGVALVGHSRGGLFARVIGQRSPELVSTVVTLGTPHRDPWRVHPWLLAQALALSVLGSLGLPGIMRPGCAISGSCCSGFWRDLAAPLSPGVDFLSIFSTTDQIVDWRACLDAGGRHAEVRTDHHDLPAHPSALRLVLAALEATEATASLVAVEPDTPVVERAA